MQTIACFLKNLSTKNESLLVFIVSAVLRVAGSVVSAIFLLSNSDIAELFSSEIMSEEYVFSSDVSDVCNWNLHICLVVKYATKYSFI